MVELSNLVVFVVALGIVGFLIYAVLIFKTYTDSRKNAVSRERKLPDGSFTDLDALSICLNRKSIRKYDPNKTELETHLKEQINAFLGDEDKMKGPFGSKIKIVLVSTDQAVSGRLGTYGVIQGAKYFLVGITNPETNLVDFGYVYERLILLCTKLGLGTCWMAGTFRSSQFKAVIKLQEQEKIYMVSPVGYSDPSALKTKVIRRPFYNIIFRGLSEKLGGKGTVKENQSQGNGFENKEECGLLGDALEAIQWAPSGINAQPWRIFVLESASDPNKKVLHFFIKKLGTFYSENDIGIAISNFTYVLEHAGRNGKLEIRKNQGVSSQKNEVQTKDDGLLPVLKEADESLTYAATWLEL
ncbi:MAG: putative Nitroreductase family protein [Streblomastix strix]|uniref:Putative Nitroreductase family protein n=1 Tax=Streblomastix strix TaxID=222440 RepID=A0A5J4VPT7_9EUKA|nr:MAG: putative Nitroreductase family protein [Streblomastix strix]